MYNDFELVPIASIQNRFSLDLFNFLIGLYRLQCVVGNTEYIMICKQTAGLFQLAYFATVAYKLKPAICHIVG